MSDTTEQSPEQLEIAFISSVDAKAKEFSAQLRDELEKMSYINLAYRRGSAGNLYGQRLWHRVIKHYQDGFGFLEAATTDLAKLTALPTADDVRMILQHLDEIGKTQGIRVSRFVTGNKKGALIYDVDGEKFELCQPKLAMAGAFHRDFSSPLKARIKGQEYYIASPTTNHTTHLLIEEDMIDRVPFSALLGLMHEAGHEDEKINGIISTYQAGKGQTRQGRACTEYSSTRLPIKLGMNEYLRTGNARIIPHVAAEVAIFNWVVHG